MATMTWTRRINSNDDDDNDDDSDLAVLHARQVLDGPGDAHGHIQLGGDDLPSLTNLQKLIISFLFTSSFFDIFKG